MTDLILALWGIVLIALSGLAIAAVVQPRLLDEIASLIGRSRPMASIRQIARRHRPQPGIRAMDSVVALGSEIGRISLEYVRRSVARTAGALALALGYTLHTLEQPSQPTEPSLVDRDVDAGDPRTPNEVMGRSMGAAVHAGAPAWTGQAATSDDGPRTAMRRILSGDRAVFERLVADLAGSDHDSRRRWHDLLDALFEAVLERALDAGLVDPSPAHPFWGAFTHEQARRILSALASLGFRLDGLGGWLDGRVPGKRDLSIALGYADLDPVRLRTWPAPAEMAGLVRDATIAGAEYLDKVAPRLTLAELAAALGPQALSLAELWLHWERVRPLLLAEAPGRPADS